MSVRRVAFVYAPETERFTYPTDCPFKTRRVSLTRQRLASFGLVGGPDRPELAGRRATREELLRFHGAGYLDALEVAAAGTLTYEGMRYGLGGPDTPVFPDMYAYGAWAAGSALTAAATILGDGADVVFSLAGGFHHARAEQAAGFCYLNDAVLACLRLAEAGRRVLYLDLDAHHGDGVQEAFYARSDVLTVSLHESGQTLYPGTGFETETGEGPGAGYCVNVPLPPGIYDEAYLAAFEAVVPPLAREYGPDVVVLELGMDTLAGDPLTHLALTNNAHVEMIHTLMRLGRPILVLGGGGYHVEHTVRGWVLAWRTFCGEEAGDADHALGGVMLGSGEWLGGLRDRVVPVRPEDRERIEPEVRRVAELVTLNALSMWRGRTFSDGGRDASGDSGAGVARPPVPNEANPAKERSNP